MDTSGFFEYPTPYVADQSTSSGFLEQASEREWDTLLAAMQTVILRPGDTAFAEGRPDPALYLLTDGVLTVSYAGAAPAEITAPPAEVINAMAFLDGGRCIATARAVTDVRMLRLSFDAFESLAAREPPLARRIILDLARRVAQQLRRGSGPLP
jgi:CRP-like cAMP-binding protein